MNVITSTSSIPSNAISGFNKIFRAITGLKMPEKISIFMAVILIAYSARVILKR